MVLVRFYRENKMVSKSESASDSDFPVGSGEAPLFHPLSPPSNQIVEDAWCAQGLQSQCGSIRHGVGAVASGPYTTR